MAALQRELILVTGATDGIGKETALDLARKGHTVIVHGRSASKVAAVATELGDDAAVKAAGGSLDTIVCDLSSLRAVKALAEQVVERFPGLTVLVNNAGLWTSERQVTDEGVELSFAVNHLAPLMLTEALVPTLAKNGATRSRPTRVVFVSSIAHCKYPNSIEHDPDAAIDWGNLQAEKAHDPYRVYALSKLCNVMTTQQFAKLNKPAPVTFNSLHPGIIDTKLLARLLHDVDRPDLLKNSQPCELGARTSVFVASDPSLDGVTGTYFVDCKEARMSDLAKNDENLERLWTYSHQVIARALDPTEKDA